VATRADELLTARELARLLKVSSKTVYRLAWSGDLPAFKISRKCVRFDLEAVRRWLEMRAVNKGGLSEVTQRLTERRAPAGVSRVPELEGPPAARLGRFGSRG
jgi:excisionase family DNA binding protein